MRRLFLLLLQSLRIGDINKLKLIGFNFYLKRLSRIFSFINVLYAIAF